MFPYVTLFGRVFPVYGVLGVVGALLGLFSALRTCKRFSISREDCAYLYVFIAAGALVGAKVFYLLGVLPQLCGDLPLLFSQPGVFFARYLSGGMVFYGGLFGGVLTSVLYCRAFHWKLGDFLPAILPSVPLFHGFGRLGCFCAGCCYGVEVPWGLAFSQSPIAPNGVPLFPVQLVEAAGLFVMYFVFLHLARKVAPWRLLGLYVLCYAVLRFVLEFFRGDAARGSLWIFSTSQWLSFAAAAAGAVLLWKTRRQTGRPRGVKV